MSCEELKLPPIVPILEDEEFNIFLESETANAMMEQLNDKQREFVDTIIKAIYTCTNSPATEPQCYFLDGPGGTGKTTCYNTLISYCRSHGHITASAAWTGIAATLLKGRANNPINYSSYQYPS